MVVFVRRMLCIIALVISSPGWAANFVTTVDRKELAIDEHLTLTLSLYNSDTRLRAQGVDPNIDLTLLARDFEVGTPHETVNYNIFRSRGRAASELNVDLFPRHTGNLTIPSFTIDGETSAQITIVAKESAYKEAPLAFAETGVSSTTPWQGQQVVAYLDLFARVELSDAKLGGEPETEPRQFEVLENYALPQTERDEKRHGFTYHVIRRAWAFYPDSQGALKLFFPDVWLETRKGDKLRLANQRINLDIKPATAGSSPLLVGKTELEISLAQTGRQVGEPWIFAVTLRTQGARKAIPATIPVASTPEWRMESDQARIESTPTADGVTQFARYTVSVTPLVAGTWRLPPLNVSYWNTENGQSAEAMQTFPEIAVTAIPPEPTPDRLDPQFAPPAIVTATHRNGWQWLALFAIAGWLMTLVAWWRSQARRPKTTDTNHPTPITDRSSPRPLEARLLKFLNSRSLAEGLVHYETQFGRNDELRNLIAAVQRLYYGPPASKQAVAHLETQVNNTLNQLPPLPQSQPTDPWSPLAFTRNLGSAG